MVLEADRLGCAERGDRDRRRAVDPGPARAAVRQDRRRPTSCTRASPTRTRTSSRYLNLWRYLRELPARSSPATSSASAAWPSTCTTCACASGRTWSSSCARRPRASACASTARRPSRATSTARCSPGLLSHVGMKDARGARVRGRARRAVRDLPRLGAGQEAAELGDGGRAGRDVAAVGADGGADRSRPTSSRWPGTWSSAPTASRAGIARRGSVVATERVTLYGLPIVTDRTVAVRADRPGALARAVHPRARWSRASGRRGTRSWPRTGGWSRRSRRSSTARGGATSWSTTRRCSSSTTRGCPADVVSAARFDRWWRDERRDDPDLLTFTRDAAGARAAEAVDARTWPATWRQGELDPGPRATASSRAPRTTA